MDHQELTFQVHAAVALAQQYIGDLQEAIAQLDYYMTSDNKDVANAVESMHEIYDALDSSVQEHLVALDSWATYIDELLGDEQ